MMIFMHYFIVYDPCEPLKLSLDRVFWCYDW